MKKNVAIVVDSSIDLSSKQATALGYTYVPIKIIENSKKEYQDGIDINKEELLKLFNQGADLKTCQVNIGEASACLEKLIASHSRVIVIPLSSKLSGTYNIWKMAEGIVESDRVLVLDSEDVANTLKWVAKEVKQMAESGSTNDAIEKFVNERKTKRMGVLITTDMDRLIKGGRLSPIKGLLAKILKINVVIKFQGKLEFYKKTRSPEDSIEEALMLVKKVFKIENFSELKNVELVEYFDDDAKEEFKQIENDFLKKTGLKKVEITTMPNTIACHTGKNSYGIMVEKF